MPLFSQYTTTVFINVVFKKNLFVIGDRIKALFNLKARSHGFNLYEHSNISLLVVPFFIKINFEYVFDCYVEERIGINLIECILFNSFLF